MNPEKGAMDFVRRLSVIPGRVRLSSLAGKIGALVDGRIVAAGLLAALIGLSVHKIWTSCPTGSRGDRRARWKGLRQFSRRTRWLCWRARRLWRFWRHPQAGPWARDLRHGFPAEFRHPPSLCADRNTIIRPPYTLEVVFLRSLLLPRGRGPFFWVTSGLGGRPGSSRRHSRGWRVTR